MEEGQALGIPRHAWEGNRRADKLAGQGAEEHAVPAEEVLRAQRAVGATERTQLWTAEAFQLAAGARPAETAAAAAGPPGWHQDPEAAWWGGRPRPDRQGGWVWDLRP